MKRLWAPWRRAYIRPKHQKDKRCLFCRLRQDRRDSQNFILYRNPTCYAVLNLYPYNNGHVLIVPNRHVDSFARLSRKERLDWLDLTQRVLAALSQSIRPHGFNIGMNLGQVAGAGVPDHLHLHLVPRWQGDTNFMPVLGQTRVISESLQSLYETLRPYFRQKKKRKR